jgi:hypothetical protein
MQFKVNRLDGPFGNANGVTMNAVRDELVSPHVDNNLPRNAKYVSLIHVMQPFPATL